MTTSSTTDYMRLRQSNALQEGEGKKSGPPHGRSKAYEPASIHCAQAGYSEDEPVAGDASSSPKAAGGGSSIIIIKSWWYGYGCWAQSPEDCGGDCGNGGEVSGSHGVQHRVHGRRPVAEVCRVRPLEEEVSRKFPRMMRISGSSARMTGATIPLSRM